MIFRKPFYYLGENYEHSSKCEWNGQVTRSARYTSRPNLCVACDMIKKRNFDTIHGKSEKFIGMSKEDKDRIYCMEARVSAERCTKHTNPSCGCGRLVWNQLPRQNLTGVEQYKR